MDRVTFNKEEADLIQDSLSKALKEIAALRLAIEEKDRVLQEGLDKAWDGYNGSELAGNYQKAINKALAIQSSPEAAPHKH